MTTPQSEASVCDSAVKFLVSSAFSVSNSPQCNAVFISLDSASLGLCPYRALHLSLGLSLLATHKTAAIFVHVSADENGSGETYKNREHLVNAFKPSSFTYVL